MTIPYPTFAAMLLAVAPAVAGRQSPAPGLMRPQQPPTQQPQGQQAQGQQPQGQQPQPGFVQNPLLPPMQKLELLPPSGADRCATPRQTVFTSPTR